MENKLTPSIQASDIKQHLTYACFKTEDAATHRDWYEASALTLRDKVVNRWIATTKKYAEQDPKCVYYLSLEFLIGRMLTNAALNLNQDKALAESLQSLGLKLEDIAEVEHDAALGNGGLGRLAACFVDSMASMDIPATGYGIRYEYGMFKQGIEHGCQVEHPDDWLRYRNIWEFHRPEVTYPIRFYGRVVHIKTDKGIVHHWLDYTPIEAQAYDVPVPGYHTETVNNLRLWSAKALKSFDLQQFNEGNYEQAVANRHLAETISQVLYPNDSSASGKELRLKQQYFFVSASIQDILKRFTSKHQDWQQLPNKVAIQLNDTHPAIAIAEMMHQLVDHHLLYWDTAWDLVNRIFAYTNHTLMPEALECWSVELFSRLLPRHMEIIYEINQRFLEHVIRLFPGDSALLSRVSILDDQHGKQVRMAHLAVVGSHTVNGVAELHSQLLKTTLFADFARIYPQKFINVTNGITPRRWLNQANPALTALIAEQIGDGFQKNLLKIRNIEPWVNDAQFRERFKQIKQENKLRLAAKIREKTGIELNPEALFDVQIKRIHEYKRQLLNLLHVITLYKRIKTGQHNHPPRVVIFAGKAAPGYKLAKQIIRLINDVANVVNHDPQVNPYLKLVFFPNYDVSAAEVLFPAADLSEQISTAGTEASGTGNMKMALNGALTIGTLDGANVEILEEVGEDNIFIFGHTTEEIAALKAAHDDAKARYQANPMLKQVIDMIADGYFSPTEPNRYHDIVATLLEKGDHYFLLADYPSYIETQDKIARLYQDKEAWLTKSILNVARMSKFSSDRTIAEYAEKIWNIHAK